jgi:hypothetical protein
MKRPKWTFKGMISQGDSDGPIYLSVAVVDGKKVEKLVPMRRKPVFIVEGNRFTTLAAALAAARK